MREIVIDTETTGLGPTDGHRVTEIGAVELVDHSPTGRTFHRYLNPERTVPADAVAVHGLTTEFLADKPLFGAVADELQSKDVVTFEERHEIQFLERAHRRYVHTLVKQRRARQDAARASNGKAPKSLATQIASMSTADAVIRE
jgi:DNA polymerase III epsilon subunit-like protein